MGPYILLKMLGQGGMCLVYRARHEARGREVALKLLQEKYATVLPSTQVADSAPSRFRREMRLMRRLQHPNLIQFLEAGLADRHLYLAMEIVVGRSLHALLAGGQLPWSTAAVIGSQVASALEYLHREGVVHRDLKPANIMISDEGEVKLGDFGLSRGMASTRITREGTIMGTLGYMAPEMFEGHPADNATDIWSFGVTLFQMLSGGLPFQVPADPSAEVLASTFSRRPELSPDLPPAIATLVGDCLERDRARRIKSAGLLYRSLASLVPDANGAALRSAVQASIQYRAPARR